MKRVELIEAATGTTLRRLDKMRSTPQGRPTDDVQVVWQNLHPLSPYGFPHGVGVTGPDPVQYE